MDDDGRRSSLWRRADIRWVVILTALGFTSFFLTLASLPYWIAETGVPLGAAGLVTTVMLVTTVTVQTVVPATARRIGRTPVLVAGTVLLSGAVPLYLVNGGLVWYLLVSAVRGAGFAMVTVVTVSLLGILVEASRRGEVVGIHGLAVNVPFLVAVPAGTALATAGHFDIVVYLAAAPSLIVLGSRRMARDLAAIMSDDHDRPSSRHARRAAVVAIVAPGLVLFAVCFPATGLTTFLPIAAPDGALAATALLMFGVAALAARWRIGKIADRVGVRVPTICSLAVVAFGMIVVAAGLRATHMSDIAVVAGALFVGVGYGGIQNLSLVTAFRRAGTGGAMTASFVWNIAFDSGIAVGAVAVGGLAERWGIPTTYLICAAVVLVAVPLARVAARPAPGQR